MPIEVTLNQSPVRKRELQEQLTALLPQWFGKPDSNAAYAKQAEVLDGYIAMSEGAARGLLLLKQTSPISAEIFWMGVDPRHHRAGIGRALIDRACTDARSTKTKYLFVATLHPDDPYEPYQRTRRFYEAQGFRFVLEEQFPADAENPLAYYIKELI